MKSITSSLPSNLHSLLCHRKRKASCPWSVSTPNFRKRANAYPSWQMRQSDPILDTEYGRTMAGLLCSRYLPNETEDEEYRLLHVYRKGLIKGRKKIQPSSQFQPDLALSSGSKVLSVEMGEGKICSKNRTKKNQQPLKEHRAEGIIGNSKETGRRSQQTLTATTSKKTVKVSIMYNVDNTNQDIKSSDKSRKTKDKATRQTNKERIVPPETLSSSVPMTSSENPRRRSKRRCHPSVRYGSEFIKTNKRRRTKERTEHPDLQMSLEDSENILTQGNHEQQSQDTELSLMLPCFQRADFKLVSTRIEVLANHLDTDVPPVAVTQQISHLEMLVFGKHAENLRMEGQRARLISRIRYLENELGLSSISDRIKACLVELGVDHVEIGMNSWDFQDQLAYLEAKVFGKTKPMEELLLVERVRRLEINLGLK